MASAPRDSRRRKIVDRGADRLALITGQIHALPSEPTDDPSKLLNSQAPLPHLSDQITDGVSDSTLPNHECATIAAGNGGSTVEPSSRRYESGPEASIAPSAETSSKVESSLATPTVQKSTRSTSGTVQSLRSFATPNEIISAIAASEKSRLRCSVVVALLVVLSHLGFPLLGSNFIRSIISFRPLYLLLLTNVTLVLAPLLLNKQRGFKRAVEAENEIPSSGGSAWTEQAGNALEVAFVIQKASDAQPAFSDKTIHQNVESPRAVFSLCKMIETSQIPTVLGMRS
ncbi:unnamed protein product [Dovyalis caffra]|uniref:Uncharacterized protein n=1 Tax=Dovyalis caffra TaxID=77055 RepID=A0AAV1SLN8_9ROSI|nr:unnamed protein product [Dovyalis caffra]